MIPPSIKNQFAAFSHRISWVLCNSDKQPINRWTGKLLSWKQNPEDSINTLPIIEESLADMPAAGFGIIVGMDNTLACFDLDGALDPDGAVINPNVKAFLDVMYSFVEVSTSGKGLHVFVNLSEPHTEYGLDEKFCGGKFYPARFIKLTGNVYAGYDLPIRVLTKQDSEIIQNKIGVAPASIPQQKYQQEYPSNGKVRDWGNVLMDAGILHITAPQYVGSSRQHGTVTRTCKAAWKIQCPNKKAHSDHRRANDFSADAALLLYWSDGSTSCTCNHNSCNPALRPNLLKKLWQQVREGRMEQARQRLHRMGLMV